MKKLLLVLLTGFISISAIAQNVHLVFNPSNNNRTYQIAIDGVSYNSTRNVKANGSPVGKTVILSGFDTGPHTLAVYRINDNNGNTTRVGNTLYSNSFTVRTSYDMIITVMGNGQVSFSERNSTTTPIETVTRTPMNNNEFRDLLTEIRANRYQSARISAIREAFGSSTDFFTVSQVRQMLQLITAESSRLELVKLSYDKSSDPENFSELSNLFTAQAARNDFNEFVRTRSGGTVVVPNDSRNAMTLAAFDQLMQSINFIDQPAAVIGSREAFTRPGNYFTTLQARKILSLIATEVDRLELAKLAYGRVTDPTNFPQVYSLLYNQPARQELSSHIVRNGGVAGNINIQPRLPMPDAQYNELLQKARKRFFPWDSNKDIRDAFSDTSNRFTVYQVRQLLSITGSQSLLTSETDKLELAKLGFRNLTDPANFLQLLDLFTASANKEALKNYQLTMSN